MARRLAAAVWSLVAGAAAPAVAQTPVNWPMFGFDLAHDGYNAAEQTLAPGNVGQLQTLWTHTLPAKSGVGVAQPVLAAQVPVQGVPTDLLLFGTIAGQIVALDANSSNPAGSVVWQARLPPAPPGACSKRLVFGSAAIDRAANGGAGAVFFGAAGRVFAFDLASGTTEPGWPAGGFLIPNLPNLTNGGTVYSGIVVNNGTIYVETASTCESGVWQGQISAITEASPALVTQWFTMSGNAQPPSVSGGGIWGPGGVSIDGTGAIYTATGNPYPDPPPRTPSALYGEAIVKLSPDLSQVLYETQPPAYTGDDDFGSTPILFTVPGCPGPMGAASKKSGHVAITAFSAAPQVLSFGGNGPGPASMLQATAFDPVAQLLFVTNPFVKPSTYPAGLVALAPNANCQFSTAWSATQDMGGNPMLDQNTFMSPPTVANGVVYFGVGYPPHGTSVPPSPFRVYAVADGAVAGAAAGTVLWQSSDIAAPILTAPTVVNKHVYVASYDGKIHAYAVPGL